MEAETNISDLAYGATWPPPFQVGDLLLATVPGHVLVRVTSMDIKQTENDRAPYFGYVKVEDFTGKLFDFKKLGNGIYRPK